MIRPPRTRAARRGAAAGGLRLQQRQLELQRELGDEHAARDVRGRPSRRAATTTRSRPPTIKSIDPSKFLRGSSVGFGEGPAPSFAPAVKTRRARRAGCTLRADPSAVGIHLLVSDIVPLHVDNPDYTQGAAAADERPPPADLGELGLLPAARPVRLRGAQPRARRGRHPPRPQHQPRRRHEGAAAVGGLAAVRADRARACPPTCRGAARPITSWQRAMICKTWNPRTLDGHPRLPRRLPRRRARAGALAQHAARARRICRRPCCPNPTA